MGCSCGIGKVQHSLDSPETLTLNRKSLGIYDDDSKPFEKVPLLLNDVIFNKSVAVKYTKKISGTKTVPIVHFAMDGSLLRGGDEPDIVQCPGTILVPFFL